MKVILAIVTSVDGKSTKGRNPATYEWSSKEDKKHFSSLIKKHNLIVMGSNTYDAIKSYIKLTPDKLRVVMTKNPKKYAAHKVFGQLEFSNEPIKKLISRLENLGYEQMLLVGGATLITSFFKEKLINEIFLTIEPKVFGTGKGLVLEEQQLNIDLKLMSIKKLNPQGTLLLKYQVIK